MEEWEKYLGEQFWRRIDPRIHRTSRFEWRAISSHPFLTSCMIGRYPSQSWDWRILSRQSFSKIESLLQEFPGKEWDWIYLSQHSPLDFIFSHPTLQWNLSIIWDRLRVPESRPIPVDISLDIQSLMRFSLYDWRELSQSGRIDLSLILAHPHLPWKWSLVTRHPMMTMTHICQHPDHPWDWNYAMRHLNFNLSHMHPPRSNRLLLDYNLLSTNPHMHPGILKSCLDRAWDMTELARHPAFLPHKILHDPILSGIWRWDMVLRHPLLSWDCYQSLRHQFHIPHHFLQLCQNHFLQAASLPPYYDIVRKRFLHDRIHRRRLLNRLTLLNRLLHRLPRVIVQCIMDMSRDS